MSFLPSNAIGGMAGIWIIMTLCVMFVYHMTRNIVLSSGIEAAGSIVLLVIYFVKSSVYEGILEKILGNFALTNVFTNVSDNNLLDVKGIVFYLTLIGVFLFLTVQTIQKRRFS